MPSILAVFLVLGLGLSQRSSTQKQMLSKPAIWVRPSFMIPKGRSATIGCRGAGEAMEYQLHFEGGLSALERPKSSPVMNWVKFPIPAMTSHTAGQYRCSYRSGELWSELSDPLELVVTGLYDTPTLSVEPRSEVTSGENVTFHCQLATATSTFFLLKKGRSSRPQLRYGNLRAEFHLGPVTPAHGGTYRCFGSYNNHAWSFPSKPVKLLVKVPGDAGDTTFAPTEHTSSDYWDSYELTTGTQSQKGGAFITPAQDQCNPSSLLKAPMCLEIRFCRLMLVSWRSGKGIFLTQGSNLYLLHLLHWQVGSLSPCHMGEVSMNIAKCPPEDKLRNYPVKNPWLGRI
ncbi:natural cytotoxicity triggering receptor 1 isoform X1 [Bos javanicus]|uniref:natural cytotoxicity triggering receptor 1 isoform X1 n=1 Tax=Bos javanicus TaxID=9906 RepID=UPI002AA7126B|nr:natural cytotoxicity triggering receptor 1 isoform X1 [Bos javanicus]